MTTFPTLPAAIEAALAERGYSSATPVQAEVLRPEAAGRDLVVSAQTGSGKTVAFGLAMAGDLLDGDGRIGFAPAPLALVITPTRELALQVSRELAWLYGRTGARVATCVGGMNPSAERKVLASGPAIVVGTPGRLRDHFERGALDLGCVACPTLTHLWLCNAQLKDARSRRRRRLPTAMAADIDPERGRAAALAALADAAAAALVVAEASLVIADAAAALVVR